MPLCCRPPLDDGDVYAWGVNKGNVLGNVVGQGAYNVMVRATRMNVSVPAEQATIGCVPVVVVAYRLL